MNRTTRWAIPVQLGFRAAVLLAAAAASGCRESSTPATAPTTPIMTQVVAAREGVFTCGLTGSGAAYCWGENSFGEIGGGDSAWPMGPDKCGGIPCSRTPVAVSGEIAFSAIAAGAIHACGLTSAGAVYCWGGLGDSIGGSTTPVAVSGGRSFTVLTSGAYHNCALTSAGAAYCWGVNTGGQLGDGTTAPSATPVAVSGGVRFTTLAAGFSHTCGLASTGVAYCWGGDAPLGNGSDTATGV